MEPVDHMEMPLMTYLLIGRMVEVEDACGSPDSPLLQPALEVPRSVDKVHGLESWE